MILLAGKQAIAVVRDTQCAIEKYEKTLATS